MCMTTINKLNDDCLFAVFEWLTLTEKCGVQRVCRRWQRITRDFFAVQDHLKLLFDDPKKYDKLCEFCDHSDGFYTTALADFFRNGILTEKLELFFRKFAINNSLIDSFNVKTENTDPFDSSSDLVLPNVTKLTLLQCTCICKSLGTVCASINLDSLEKVLSMFNNLKSLELINVDFNKEADLSVIWRHANQIETFKLSFYTTFDNNFSKSSNFYSSFPLLKELKTDFLQAKDIENLFNLERIEAQVRSTEELQEILLQHPRLTRIAAEVYDKDNFEWESFNNFSFLLASFEVLPFFREIDILYGDMVWRDSCLAYSGSVLYQVMSLTVRNVKLSVGDMRCLASCFPSLKSFSLLQFQLNFFWSEKVGERQENDEDAEKNDEDGDRDANGENEEDAEKDEDGDEDAENDSRNDVISDFLRLITTYSNLRKLTLEHVRIPPWRFHANRNTNTCFPSRLLFDFLSSFQKLRILSCNCFDIDDCFEAFCDLARQNPKKSFAFKEFNSYNPPIVVSGKVKKRKPRNVSFF